MRNLILISTIYLACQQASAITLEQSVAAAIDTNPQISQQYAQFEASVRKTSSAGYSYKPQVRIDAGIGYEETYYQSGEKLNRRDDDETANPNHDLTRKEASLTISQMLFDGFDTRYNVSRLSAEAEADRLALIARAENIALEVSNLYIELIKAKATIELAEKNVKDYEDVYNDIMVRSDKGLSSQSDVAQISARLASANSSLIASKNNYYDLRAQFNTIVGLPPENLTAPIPDRNLVPNTLQEALKEARSRHPQIKSSIADLQAAQMQFNGSKSDYYPELSLELTANKNDDIGGIPGRDEDARIMLKLSYDLYDGGRRKYEAQAAGWYYEQALGIRQNTERQVVEGMKLAWNARENLILQESLLKQNVDFARQAEGGYVQQFNIGRRSLLDVLDAKIEVFFARRNYLSAYYDRLYAEYRIINAMGLLIYGLRIEYPEQWQQPEDREDG
ncbi:adhesin transport system outer membrane protein [Sinobacterium caligoides]|uniref:Adhesin transport system outer membrane protein n=1 Tax=Sinobacterium caligoides TaxID=933926 RepID=A0A3N2DJD4_9GAMM|nr:TolC family outer membrane protein [Sinobacterium caligoides]ROR99913.1 adhesin transport system outer membrane protein [Sinobacterium caligoides]